MNRQLSRSSGSVYTQRVRSWHTVPDAYGAELSRELRQQVLRLLQVGRVKPLSEPAVDRRQQLEGFSTLALALPQPAQAHGGAQLPGFGLLAAGNGQGLLEAG